MTFVHCLRVQTFDLILVCSLPFTQILIILDTAGEVGLQSASWMYHQVLLEESRLCSVSLPVSDVCCHSFLGSQSSSSAYPLNPLTTFCVIKLWSSCILFSGGSHVLFLFCFTIDCNTEIFFWFYIAFPVLSRYCIQLHSNSALTVKSCDLHYWVRSLDQVLCSLLWGTGCCITWFSFLLFLLLLSVQRFTITIHLLFSCLIKVFSSHCQL